MNQNKQIVGTDTQEEAWRRENENAAAEWRHFRKILRWTIVAAFAAIIAVAASLVAIIGYRSGR